MSVHFTKREPRPVRDYTSRPRVDRPEPQPLTQSLADAFASTEAGINLTIEAQKQIRAEREQAEQDAQKRYGDLRELAHSCMVKDAPKWTRPATAPLFFDHHFRRAISEIARKGDEQYNNLVNAFHELKTAKDAEVVRNRLQAVKDAMLIA